MGNPDKYTHYVVHAISQYFFYDLEECYLPAEEILFQPLECIWFGPLSLSNFLTYQEAWEGVLYYRTLDVFLYWLTFSEGLSHIVKLVYLLNYIIVHNIRNIIAKIVKPTYLFQDNIINNSLCLDGLSFLKIHYIGL